MRLPLYPENGIVEMCADDVRARARTVFKWDHLRVGQMVMVNYNIEVPEERGFWFDAEITSLKEISRTNKEVRVKILLGGPEDVINDCKLIFLEEIYKIEKPGAPPLTSADGQFKRKSGPECKHCKADPDSECRFCSCCVCGGKQDAHMQLLCDECNMAFHIYCLNPPLSRIPEDEDWALALNCDAPLNDKDGAESKNWRAGKPVRVIRSSKGRRISKYAPEEGNRYDGIYKVVKYWPEIGKCGFLVWRYLLRRDDLEPAPWTPEGLERTNKLGLSVQYPEGYLEAMANKVKKDRTKRNSGKQEKQEKKEKGEKQVEEMKKKEEENQEEMEEEEEKEKEEDNEEEEEEEEVVKPEPEAQSNGSRKRPQEKEKGIPREIINADDDVKILVVKYWPEIGKCGFLVWRYLLRRDDLEPAPWTPEGLERTNKLGLSVQYPEGYLEAMANKVKKDRTKRNSGKQEKKEKGEKQVEEKMKKEEEEEKEEEKKEKEKEEEDEEEEEEEEEQEEEEIVKPEPEAQSNGSRKRPQEKVLQEDEIPAKTTKLADKGEAFQLSPQQQWLIKEDCLNKKLWDEALSCLIEGPTCLQRSFRAEVYTCPACRHDLGKDYIMVLNKILQSLLDQFFPGYSKGR
ncbi:UNVERIFIED_CONTAM: hypothetical protein FKN15_052640 [Acipenser sinensis]